MGNGARKVYVMFLYWIAMTTPQDFVGSYASEHEAPAESSSRELAPQLQDVLSPTRRLKRKMQQDKPSSRLKVARAKEDRKKDRLTAHEGIMRKVTMSTCPTGISVLASLTCYVYAVLDLRNPFAVTTTIIAWANQNILNASFFAVLCWGPLVGLSLLFVYGSPFASAKESLARQRPSAEVQQVHLHNSANSPPELPKRTLTLTSREKQKQRRSRQVSQALDRQPVKTVLQPGSHAREETAPQASSTSGSLMEKSSEYIAVEDAEPAVETCHADEPKAFPPKVEMPENSCKGARSVDSSKVECVCCMERNATF